MRGESGRVPATHHIQASDSGQAITEYLLIMALVLGGAALLGRQLVDVMDRGILKLGSEIERDLHTGKTPTDAWRN